VSRHANCLSFVLTVKILHLQHGNVLHSGIARWNFYWQKKQTKEQKSVYI